MRIIRLDLLAFGPFTGQTLNFDHPQAALHVVYGSNEAGKSSCLRALRQWLYGFPHSSSDNFIHPYPKMRIGGVVEDPQGRRLEFIRRKGHSSTLRAADDVGLIDEAQLAQLLTGVDAETFQQRFGIDHAELVSGGKNIADGGGELGDILFAAGAGIADLPRVQAQLEEELKELFSPRGSKSSINAALTRISECRKEIRSVTLSLANWQEHQQSLESELARHGQIEQQLLEQRARWKRLERLQHALPLATQLKRVRDELVELQDAPLLPADFAGRRGEATVRLAAAEQIRREALQEMERLDQLIGQVRIPTGLLENRTAITHLHTELGGYLKAAKDRPRLAAEIRAAKEHASRLLEELGRPADLDRAAAWRLNRTQRARLVQLIADYQTCQANLKTAQGAVDQAQRKLQRCRAALEELPPQRTVHELKLAYQRGVRQGELEPQLHAAESEIARLEALAQSALKQLPLLPGGLDALAQLAVPLPETIERFQEEWNGNTAEIHRHQERIQEISQRLQLLDRSLERIRLEQDVPSEEDLVQARQQRDQGWRLLLRCEQGELSEDTPEIRAFIALWSTAANLAQAFQASMFEADQVADRLRREADQVAEKARLLAEQSELARRLDAERRALQTYQALEEQLQQQWRLAWLPSGIQPLGPREMLAWLRKYQQLVEAAAEVQRQRHGADRLREQLQLARRELADGWQQSTATAPAPEQSLSELLQRCEQLLDEIEQANQRRNHAERDVQQAQEQVADADRDLTRAQREFDSWQADWAGAVQALELDGEARPDEANSTLQTLDELQGILKELSDRQHRIDGIDRDARQFSDEVTRLVREVLPELDLPVDQAVSELHGRLVAAQREQIKLDQWREQHSSQTAKRDQAIAEIQYRQMELADMCQQAGCMTAAELPDAEQRSDRRKNCDQDFGQLQAKLEALAAPGSLEPFLDEVRATDVDRLSAEMQQLDELIHGLERDKSQAAEAIGRRKAELARMDGSAAAAALQEEIESRLASVRSDAEQYIRLKLAAIVLHRAVERFRQASQGPVLDRASQLFAELTVGSFAGLRADYDDQGRAVLVGVRSDGKQVVSVSGMSDGTCDQLYLALRLALLETHLDRHAPLPLIVDDILIQFDDDRAAAALRLLEQLSTKTQVIFFTHHQRLVELAERELSPQQYAVHQLSDRRLHRPG